ncbi:adenylyltransferase/cytidyltransferase family protein [Candidatus Woesebacteria bacterium]|nr:adenylyltransferase/cytidyltransferase family protein [Candidatus Woesebacteria bacterium]MCD8527619.1 adenylyltransferase/cytidyltransferase family protein [Candidatus Woesebacteria bacterium]MCD8546409.1 adenylyltransferase/cytidyltransferase family protein [Candidatus Woesebacteria bacterium]
MLHVGHARYLEKAKSFGDILIVGVDSDKKIRHRKGLGRPVVPEDERLEMLTHLGAVDHVILKELDTPKWELIKLVQPDILVAIRENYDEEKVAALQEHCGKVIISPRMATTSTSAKLRSVQIGEAKKIETKLTKAIQEVLKEFSPQ